MRYFPYLRDRGVFITEDLHCSYWKEFDGGLFDPHSSISFFKRLADIANYEHWGVQRARSEIFKGFVSKYGGSIDEAALASIHSVEFVNSVCVVRKRAPEGNELGRRIFAGTADLVSSERLALPVGNARPPDQSTNRWSVLAQAPDEYFEGLAVERDTLKAEVAVLKATRNALKDAVTEKDRLVERTANEPADRAESDALETAALREQLDQLRIRCDVMTKSWIWRLTAPLRALKRLSRRA